MTDVMVDWFDNELWPFDVPEAAFVQTAETGMFCLFWDFEYEESFED